MTPDGQTARPLDKAATREPFLAERYCHEDFAPRFLADSDNTASKHAKPLAPVTPAFKLCAATNRGTLGLLKISNFLKRLGEHKGIAGVAVIVTFTSLAVTFYFGMFPTAPPPPKEPSSMELAWEDLSHVTFFVETLRIGVSQKLDVLEWTPALRDQVVCEIGVPPAFVASITQNNCRFSFTGQFRALDASVSGNVPALGSKHTAVVELRVCRAGGAQNCLDLNIPLTLENAVRGYLDLSYVSTPPNWPRGTQAEISILLDNGPVAAPLRCDFPSSHVQGDITLVRQTGPCSAILTNIKADSGSRYGIDLLDQFGRTLDSFVLNR